MKMGKSHGWEVKTVTKDNYKPEPGWEPFAVTIKNGYSYIWLRHFEEESLSLVEMRDVEIDE